MRIPIFYYKIWALFIIGVGYMGVVSQLNIFRWTCPIKRLTHLPCSACGTTRAIYLLLDGRLNESIQMNPLGLVTILLCLLALVVSVRDLLLQDWLLERAYNQLTKFIYCHKVAVIMIVAIVSLSNWCWNIYKGI